MNRVIGILAHVDAGKTTLAEAMLYRAGVLRTLGRVDSGNTAMDTHSLEKARGITIFASEASFEINGARFTMLDTPGHVDFSAETERVLQVLDCAVLVISGTDGVQAHTRTLWRLLSMYRVPTVIFVTKTDFARRENSDIMSELKDELSENCIDFETGTEEFSLCSEPIMEKYLENGQISIEDISMLVSERLAFPCFFGSGLKLSGVDEFLNMLTHLVPQKKYPDIFGGRVFKISRDSKGERLTHIKVTGGKLRVRDSIGGEKVSGIRIYSGGKYETADSVSAGDICVLTGLNDTYGGQGLGFEMQGKSPFLEPVMNYRVILPKDSDPQAVLPKLRLLQEEDPLLKFEWDGFLQQIYVSLMGEVQTEILKSIVRDRFDIDIEIGERRVMYRETVLEKTEGVGHYEPLRHYAEVHLILQPLARGQGLKFETDVSEDTLDRNWQRLIMMHLKEKTHLGVLTGSPVTDMKITLAAGRAHLKHTEGGDFRQATYRAVRQGLMCNKSVLLEPYYAFRIEVDGSRIGRVINDMRSKNADFDSPTCAGDMYLLKGRAPVTSMEGYASELASYTGGQGRISLELDGYDICHNADEVIEKIGYSAEGDLDNTPDSVFCANGGGFNVKWDKVAEYMHLESCIKNKTVTLPPKVNHRNINITDKELEQIMLREFGAIRRREYGIAKAETKPQPSVTRNFERKHLLIVDGYNVIFAWEDLKELALADLDAARVRLCDILSNYSAFKRVETVLVFDAYRVEGGRGEKFDVNGLHVVFTKENETGDLFIERLIADIGKNDSVDVVTSDRLIQLTAVRKGVNRVSAHEFEQNVDEAFGEMSEIITQINGFQ